MSQIEIQWLFACIGFSWGCFILGCGFTKMYLIKKQKG